MRQLTVANGRIELSTAEPPGQGRGSYDSDNGHEGGRLGRPSRDEAFLLAVNIAKVPNVRRRGQF